MQLWLRARPVFVLFVLALTAAAIGPASGAESTTGTIVGTVLDTNGVPVAGATVAAASPSGRYQTTADAHGRFVILGVVFALMSFSRVRELRSNATRVQVKAQQVNLAMQRAQGLLNDAIIYNNTAKSQEMAQIIQSAQAAPAAPQPAAK